jgi:outer membrane cobalamin receptor
MKKIHLIIIVFLINTIAIMAHNGNISGQVITVYGNNPIQSAVVILQHTLYKTETDSLGNFEFKNVPVRNYVIEITKPDFYTYTQTIDVTEGKTSRVNTILFPYLITLKNAEINALQQLSAASSQLITAADFNLRPRNSAQDLLRLVPGLFIAQHAGGGKAEQLFVRGFDCDHGTDVATFVDGIPVNMPSHGHGQGYADLHFTLPEAIATMNVDKGPYNALNGDFSTGAAIRLNTLDTLNNNFAKTEFTSTPTQRNLSGQRYVLGLNIPDKNDKTTSYVVSEFVNNASYFNNSQHFKRFNLFGKFRFSINNSTALTVTASGFQSSWDASGQLPTRAIQNGLINRFGYIDPTEGGTTSRQNFNATLSQRNTNKQLDANVYYCKYGFKLFSNFTLFANDSLRGDEIEQTDSRTILGANFSYKLFYNVGNIKTKTIFGTQIRADNIENELLHDSARVRLNYVQHSQIAQQSSALYVKQEFTLAYWIKAELALRYDYFLFDVRDKLPISPNSTKITSGTNYQDLLSPKINIVITPLENIQLFINAGQGFHSNDARSTINETTLHRLPKAIGAELGAQYTFKNRLLLSLTYWQLFNSKELVYIGDEGTTENNGTSKRSGIDALVRIQLLKRWYADVDFNTSKNYLTQDFWGNNLEQNKYIPLAPTFTTTGGITYKAKALNTSLRYRHMHNRPANEDNSIVAKGYTVLDFGASYKMKQHKIELSIENVLNTQWSEAQFNTESRLRTETTSVSEIHFTPGTPIAFKIGYTFFF